jgi:acyl-CoA reductase-like NAD-dependent aldehyde dehydrogenase
LGLFIGENHYFATSFIRQFSLATLTFRMGDRRGGGGTAPSPYEVPLAIKNIEAWTHGAPCGVCGFIFPWNFPFTLLLYGIAPALAAGNTVVVIPSEVTPLSSRFAARLAAESGLPGGVINMFLGAGRGSEQP